VFYSLEEQRVHLSLVGGAVGGAIGSVGAVCAVGTVGGAVGHVLIPFSLHEASCFVHVDPNAVERHCGIEVLKSGSPNLSSLCVEPIHEDSLVGPYFKC
jgi:hypothetical protein